METKLKVKRLTENAKLPVRATAKSAGLDLFSSENVVIETGKATVVRTGIQIVLPSNTYGRIAPRSGLTLHHSLDIGGEIKF